MGFRSIFLYLLYAVFVFVFFLVILFPGDRVAQSLSETINARYAHQPVTIDDMVLLYPRPGVGLSSIHIIPSPPSPEAKLTTVHSQSKFLPNRAGSEDPFRSIEIEAFDVFPRIVTFLGEKKTVDFNASLYNGTASGVISVVDSDLFEFSEKKPPEEVVMDVGLSDIAVNALPLKAQGVDIVISCVIDGDIKYNLKTNTPNAANTKNANINMESKGETPDQGGARMERADQSEQSNSTRSPSRKRSTSDHVKDENGIADLTFSDCLFRSNDPFLKQMGLTGLEFTRIDTILEMNNGAVDVSLFEAMGSEMNVSAKGTVHLKTPVEKSILRLEGELMPNASKLSSLSAFAAVSLIFGETGKGIPFKIVGTLERPEFKL